MATRKSLLLPLHELHPGLTGVVMETPARVWTNVVLCDVCLHVYMSVCRSLCYSWMSVLHHANISITSDGMA